MNSKNIIFPKFSEDCVNVKCNKTTKKYLHGVDNHDIMKIT